MRASFDPQRPSQTYLSASLQFLLNAGGWGEKGQNTRNSTA